MVASTLALLSFALLCSPPTTGAFPVRRTCGEPLAGRAACLSMRVMLPATKTLSQVRAGGAPSVRAGERSKPYTGFLTPELLHEAYSLPTETTDSADQTIALVDAFDDPTAEADLAKYDRQFELPACTSQNGCFRKVNQNGRAAPLPAQQGEWAGEISIDVQMAHAICQNCKLLLVETDSESFADLGAGVDTAAALGATEISNSYGAAEESAEAEDDSDDYDHAGIVLTASSGDCGYENTSCEHEPIGASFPADTPTVIAVGGTALRESGGTWSSTAWAEGGSGCSDLFSAALWQSAAAGFGATGCGDGRAIADVSAVGDPNTGVNIYDSTPETPNDNQTGWGVWGGTSVSAPIVAAEFALAGGANGVSYPSSTLYSHAGEATSLVDVTSGVNGQCEGRTICAAASTFDGPTGIGSPIGLGAFAVAGAPVPTSAPAISGYAEEGDTLTEAHGGWTGKPSSFSYQWERCNFGGANCKAISEATAQTFLVPQGYTGYTLRVRETARNAKGPNNAVSATVGPVASGTPSIASISPVKTITGATISVEGTALDQASAVTVAGATAQFSVLSQRKLSVIVPNGIGKGRIAVTSPLGSVTAKQKLTPTLSVRSLTPGSGPPGTIVTIRGIGFGTGSQVNFGGAAATVLKRSATKLTAVVPPGAVSSPVAVTNTAAPTGTVYSASSFTP